MLQHRDSYTELLEDFTWNIPKYFNIGTDVADRHTSKNRTALIYEDPEGKITTYTFQDLMYLSNRLANALTAKGLRRGDRIAILLPQSPETAISHVAAYKIGAIAIPLFIQFGEDALRYRLADSGARVLITNRDNVGQCQGTDNSQETHAPFLLIAKMINIVSWRFILMHL